MGSAPARGKAIADLRRVPGAASRDRRRRFPSWHSRPQPTPRAPGAPPRSLHGDASLLALIEKVKTGNRAALDALTRLIRPHVERQLGRYPVSDDNRLDLVQSTLLQVVRRIRSFRGDSSFTTWLFRVTANEALMLMRSQRRQRARLVEGLDLGNLSALPTMHRAPAEDDAASLAEREAHVRHALGELPNDCPQRRPRALPRRSRAPRDRPEALGERERGAVAPAPRAGAAARAILNATPLGRELAEAAA